MKIGSVWIVFNGEIYNHQDLRKNLRVPRSPLSHPERHRNALSTCTRSMGGTASQHLRGMFAFAIWDRPRRCLFLARDRLGIKPLYYRYDGKTLLFGSEIKAILAYPGVKPEFNRGTLAEYLAFGYIAAKKACMPGSGNCCPATFSDWTSVGN